MYGGIGGGSDATGERSVPAEQVPVPAGYWSRAREPNVKYTSNPKFGHRTVRSYHPAIVSALDLHRMVRPDEGACTPLPSSKAGPKRSAKQ